MIQMTNRKKVILHRHDGWKNDYKLALTQEQIDLLGWLLDEDLVDTDDWGMQVLEDVEEWVEV